MISNLKDVLSNIFIFVLSAIIILIILEYRYKFLKIRSATRLFQELFDKLNIIYLVKEIIKLNYENLVFFIPNDSKISEILKIIIFVNNINKA